MKKYILFTVIFLLVFFSGFFTRQFLPSKQSKSTTMKKVTGIGGVFFKCKDPEKIKEWYSKHLGFNMDQYGTSFEWRQSDDPSKYGSTQWSPFSGSTSYFDPSIKEFMINYRVQDLENLVIELKRDGVTIVDSIEYYDYGKFVHILDNEENKIELWEPVDEEYDKITKAKNK
jgi:predicted enzyme related to lactoylglutathione lyase